MDFVLNAEHVSVPVHGDETLLQVLREGCGVTSVKDGCAPEGSCGACTVLVDGKAVVSCAQPAARFEGRAVVTQEGLSAADRDLWADSFVSAGASQCGFCSPGLLMKAEALLAKTPEPSRDQIASALAGNLCRCTGYVKIIDAVLVAAAAKRGEPIPALDPSGRVGTRTARHQGRELALGDKPYVNDMTLPGMLHAAIRFADHPRATVLRVDVSAARRHPGVVAVLTADDVPGDRVQGEIFPDWPQLVATGEDTRYVGDVLALVAADSRAAAREAAALVRVDYDVLEPVTDPLAAMADGAPQLHDRAPRNVLSVSEVKRGDVDAALAAAAHVVTDTLPDPADRARLPRARVGTGPADRRRRALLHAGAGDLERPAPGRRPAGAPAGEGPGDAGEQRGGVRGQGGPQRPGSRRAAGRADRAAGEADAEPRGEPALPREAAPADDDLHVGCDADGRLLGVRARIVGDTGAYASVGNAVLERAAGHACGIYKFDAVDVEATAVYTNNVPCGAMRGFGVNQVTFALEGLVDELADRVGISRWEMRWRNALDVGDTFGTGQVLGPGVGIKKTLLAVKDAFEAARFAGIGCAVKNTGIGNGLPDAARVVLRPEADGSLTLWHCWTEMGQGVHTVLTQMLCEELGITPDRVHVHVDTEHELGVGQTTASRGTTLGGRAVLAAVAALKDELGDRPLESLAGREFPGEFVVDWTTPNSRPPAERVTHLAYGWATQVVVLDDEGRIARVVAAHDVGRVINPLLLEGQIEGAVHMGLGQALSEEYVVVDGVPTTTTLKSLNLIPPTGMPPVECIFVEEHQPEGPYGAKGVGEIGLVPTAAAVAGALRAYDGVRRTALPMKDSPAAVAAVPRLGRSR